MLFDALTWLAAGLIGAAAIQTTLILSIFALDYINQKWRT